MTKSVDEDCKFSDFCKLLDAISSVRRKPDKRKDTLRRFIALWRQKHIELHGISETDDSFYAAMRLLLPKYDKERGPYGFREHMLAKKLIDILVMDKKGADAQLLLNYQSPVSSWKHRPRSVIKLHAQPSADFAQIASDVLKYRIDKGHALTLRDLNGRLDVIAEANGKGDKSVVERELEYLCRSVDAMELKWLIRILLKEMKVGMLEATVLNTFHPEASQLYDVNMSLRQVCERLRDPDSKLDVIQIELFIPFRPMLANRCEPQKVPEIMGGTGKPFYVEIKYDGERCQLHKSGDEYRYFSRNGNDFTSSYGRTPDCGGSFTQFIHRAFERQVKSCILDGEMIGWNPEARVIATKGEHFDVKALKTGDLINPCFVAFDCLMLNGQVLTTKPINQRIEVLKTIFDPVEGRILMAEREMKSSIKEVQDSLDLAIERREEGLIIKRPDSTYKLNARSNDAGWLKIKPDYVDEICDDLDLVIVGGYFGDGRRSNLMSHFLLALGDVSLKSSDGRPDVFVSLCKVGSGYSMKELYDLNLYLNAKCTLTLKKPPDWCKLSRERPDVYIDPRNSKILQIRAAEINTSSSFAAGFTLRFPRVEKIRDDKNWYDVMTFSDFLKLNEEYNGKLARKNSDVSASTEGDSKLAQLKTRRRMAPAASLGPQFKPADLKRVKTVHDVFHDKEFCVLNGQDSGPYTKEILEIKIKELGGTVVQHATPNTFCVLADHKVIKMKSLMVSGTVNMVKAYWLIKCVEQQKAIPWKPSDMWFATDDTKLSFADYFDEFGDSYFEPVCNSDLIALLDAMPEHEITHGETAEFFADYMTDYKYALFSQCSVYVDMYEKIGDVSTKVFSVNFGFVEEKLKLYGANILTDIDPFCTHVVLFTSDLSRLDAIDSRNRDRIFKFHVVDQIWVDKCISDGKIVSELAFHP